VKLIGIVYGVATYGVDGQVLIQNAPTQLVLPSRVNVPINVGACLMASRVLEFEALMLKAGLKAPPGYIARTDFE